MRNSVGCRSYNCCRYRIRGKTSKISIFTTTQMKWKKSDFETADFFSKKEDVTVDDVRDNWYVERSNNILAVDYFLSYFIRVVVKKINWNLWSFSSNPATTTIIWPTADRIPHSSIFKKMQIKRIADSARALFF